MTKGQKIQNERFIMMLISAKKSWLYLDAMELYNIANDEKIQPVTLRGYEILKEIVRNEFFNNYVLPPNVE